MAALAACAVQHMHVMNAEGLDKPALHIRHCPQLTDVRRHVVYLSWRLTHLETDLLHDWQTRPLTGSCMITDHFEDSFLLPVVSRTHHSLFSPVYSSVLSCLPPPLNMLLSWVFSYRNLIHSCISSPALAKSDHVTSLEGSKSDLTHHIVRMHQWCRQISVKPVWQFCP